MTPKDIRAVGASAIGPCMLPVDRDGAPLMNGVLYGVDTRAANEIEELTGRIGADRILDRAGNALTSQSVGPKILWLKRNRPEIYARVAQIPDLDFLSGPSPDRRLHDRPLHRERLEPALRSGGARLHG